MKPSVPSLLGTEGLIILVSIDIIQIFKSDF